MNRKDQPTTPKFWREEWVQPDPPYWIFVPPGMSVEEGAQYLFDKARRIAEFLKEHPEIEVPRGSCFY